MEIKFDIDESYIKGKVTSAIVNKTEKEIEKTFRDKQYNWDTHTYDSEVSKLIISTVQKEAKKMLEEERDYIINKSIENLTRNMLKTKIVKEILTEEMKDYVLNNKEVLHAFIKKELAAEDND